MILTSTVNHYVVFTQLTPQGRKETIGNEKRPAQMDWIFSKTSSMSAGTGGRGIVLTQVCPVLMAYPEHGAINLLFVVYGLFVVHESFGCYKVYNIRFWVMEDVYEGVCGSWRIVYIFRSYLLKDFFSLLRFSSRSLSCSSSRIFLIFYDNRTRGNCNHPRQLINLNQLGQNCFLRTH